MIPAVLPLPARAGVCDTYRPGWDGIPVSAWSEAVSLAATPASLLLLVASALAVRMRSQWGVLAVCVSWSVLVSVLAFHDGSGGQRAAAMAEGCVGSPSVFIAAVGLLCIGLIVAGGPPARRG